MNIIGSILEVAKEEGKYGASQTKIMYKVFLSYEQLKQYLLILAENNLLLHDEETRTLKITDKGLRFLEIYCEMRKVSLAEEVDDNNNNKPLARLLVVDDESDIVEVLRRGLEANGFKVDASSSPRQALFSFKPDVYDLAILDVRMPGLSGFDLYREIKRIDPSLTACFLSAFEIHPEEFQKMFSPSMEEVKTIIKKPVSLHNLMREIAPLLRASAIARAQRGDHLAVAFDISHELIEQSLQFFENWIIGKR